MNDENCNDGVRSASSIGDLPDLNRGNSIVLKPPAGDIAVGPDTSIIEVRTQCGGAQVINCMLGLELEGQSNLSQSSLEESAFVYPSVRATLKWGIGGTSFSAECDYMMGTQLSICAENFRVGAKYMKNTRPWAPESEPLAPNFRCSAGVGYNNTARNSNPARLTELVQIPLGGDPIFVQIPQFALSMTSYSVVGEMRVEIIGFGGNYNVVYTTDLGEGTPVNNNGQYNVENAVPFFNGARFLKCSNNNVEPSDTIAFIIFGLSL